MSNSAYETKRKTLVASNLLLNRYFARVEKWDVEAIERRAREVADQVAVLWPNPRQSAPAREAVMEPPGRGAKLALDVELLRTQSLARLANLLGAEPLQRGDARYVARDGQLHLLCLASQPYANKQGEGYWFGVTPMQLDFVGAGTCRPSPALSLRGSTAGSGAVAAAVLRHRVDPVVCFPS
jgi:hypothetical protein